MTDTMIAVPLDECSFVPKARRLFVPEEVLHRLPGQGRFPKTFFVKSHFTNTVVEFVSIDENDPLFDQDQWDGELMYYKPRNGTINKIEYAVVLPGELL